jgi:hypothetical protein
LNEELTWLRLQDVQREAENRRLRAGSVSSSTMADLWRLFTRKWAAVRPGKSPLEPVAAASAERRQEVA